MTETHHRYERIIEKELTSFTQMRQKSQRKGGGLQHQDPRRRICPGGVVQDTEVGSHRIIEDDEDDEDVYSIGVGEVH